MKMLVRIAAMLCCLWMLSSCAPAVKQTPVPPPTPVATDYPADLQGAKLYRLSPEQSTLHILVYRGGAMANLGHNHVVSSHTVSGYVWLHESLLRSGFNITQSVNDLIVDDPQTRAAEGEDFQSTVNDSSRAGTRVNMLKPVQLDGEHYPIIRLRSLGITGDRAQPQVQVRITIKDQSRDVTVPMQLSADARSLRVKGQFQIKQSEFGMTPYSVAMGALQVLDQLTIKFELVAIPTA